jgi:CubicO group peptidase (beta-lactamase class C family)
MRELGSIDAFATRVLATGTAPGLAVAITDRERTLEARTYGDASEDHLWPIASIGKSFTAAVAVQLSDEGRLDLDAPVVEHLPWFSVRTLFAPITVRHLLAHSSGLIEALDSAPNSNVDVLGLADTEAGFAPGEHYHYSNIGYRAVGAVLERVTGKPYGELVRRRVLDPLGMHASVPTMVHDTRRRLPGGNVPFYDDRPWRREDGLVPAPWVESQEADGCLCCSAEDLAIYLRALWSGAVDTRGYGLEIDDDGFGHDGDMLGYVSYMWVDTKAEIGAVAFANGFRGARALGEGALAIARGEEPAGPECATPPPLVDDGSCPVEWAAYLGRYRAHNPWLPTFAIAARQGTLVMGTDWLAGSQRITLAAIEPGTFRAGDDEWSPERLRFEAIVDGLAQRAVYSGTPYYRALPAAGVRGASASGLGRTVTRSGSAGSSVRAQR